MKCPLRIEHTPKGVPSDYPMHDEDFDTVEDLMKDLCADDAEVFPSAVTETTLFQKLSKDLSTHGDSLFSPGFQAIAVARLGAARMGIKSGWLRKPLSLLYKLAARNIVKAWGIELPHTVDIGEGVRIDHQNSIVVHGNAVIGHGCVIRQGVTIGVRSGKYCDRHRAPMLGCNVDIGAGAVIVGDIAIGHNVTIGANSVVTRDVPNDATVVGANRIVDTEATSQFL